MSMNRFASLLTLSAVVLLAAWSAPRAAFAQVAPGSDSPIGFSADTVIGQQQPQCVLDLSGAADVLQDTSRLRADVVKIYYKLEAAGPAASAPKGGQKCSNVLDRMEADGSVYYVTPNQVVKGDHAVYTADDTTIVVTGTQVVATQGKNVVAGARLVVNTDTGEATMVTGIAGRGREGRVRGVFYSSDQPAGGAAGPAASSAIAAPTPSPPRNHSP
jgi:lipopolysaccharide export system protein LptA